MSTEQLAREAAKTILTFPNGFPPSRWEIERVAAIVTAALTTHATAVKAETWQEAIDLLRPSAHDSTQSCHCLQVIKAAAAPPALAAAQPDKKDSERDA